MSVEPIRWPAEHIVLETVDGYVRITRRARMVADSTDARPYTGWERAKPRLVQRGTPKP